MLEVCETEMKSIVFIGIDKTEMQEVRKEMEKRYEDGDTVPGTRSSHHFIPLSSSRSDVSYAVRMSLLLMYMISTFQVQLTLVVLHLRLMLPVPITHFGG